MSKHRSTDEPILGQIGYRTRDGRTGLDPIETQLEASHMEGVFIRKLFTGKLRTRNPLYLAMMALFAFFLLAFPIIGTLSVWNSLSRPNVLRDQVLIPIACMWPVGLLLLFNTIMSLSAHHGDKHHGK